MTQKKIAGITNPEDAPSAPSSTHEAIRNFEKILAIAPKGKEVYRLVILGEYSATTCKEIEGIYAAEGWLGVKCFGSSQKGGSKGCTVLQLCRSVGIDK